MLKTLFGTHLIYDWIYLHNMKKLLVLVLILFSFDVIASEAHLSDGIFTIRDLFFIVNMVLGLAWNMVKIWFFVPFYLPSYIFVGALIDTPFGAFLEIPEYGYAISTYFSLAYWIGIFIIFFKIDETYPNRNFGIIYVSWFAGPFILGFLGLLNGWWLSERLTLEFFRISEFANCINSDNLDCWKLF